MLEIDFGKIIAWTYTHIFDLNLMGSKVMKSRQSLFASCALSILIIANIAPGNFQFGSQNDKLNHFVAFFVLTSLTVFAFPARNLTLILLFLFGFNALIELSQGLLALGREPSLIDIAAGVLATTLVLSVEYVRRSGRSAPTKIETEL